MAEQLARALHPSLTNVHVQWKSNQAVLYTAPKRAPPVFADNRLIFYALLDESMPFDHTTTVELVSDMSPQPLSVVRVDRIPPMLGSPTIRRLAAKALLRELLHASEATPQERLVDLSLKYGVLCPYTAFVGVERRLGADLDSNAGMELREVAIMSGPREVRGSSVSPRQSYHLPLNSSANRPSSSQADVDYVQCVMRANIDRVLERDETLSQLECHSEMLQMSSSAFSLTASRLKRRRGMNVSALLQPIAGLFSSLFSRQSAASSPVEAKFDAEVEWSQEEHKLVERCIERQQYDGIWLLTEEDVKQLTGKSLNYFSSTALETMTKSDRARIMTTVIVMGVLETRCISSKILWQALFNKAHKRVTDLLQENQEQVEQLLKDIRSQLLWEIVWLSFAINQNDHYSRWSLFSSPQLWTNVCNQHSLLTAVVSKTPTIILIAWCVKTPKGLFC